jgi:hypothetical protein
MAERGQIASVAAISLIVISRRISIAPATRRQTMTSA